MSKSFRNYVRFKFNGKETYVREDKVASLKDVDAAIFDCDGVLIDIRDSYNRAISETVAYVLKRLTGFPLSTETITDEIIFMFRKSGGFNNDWDVCYGILMYMLCHLPRELQEALKASAKEINMEDAPLKRLVSIEDAVRERSGYGMLNEAAVNQIIKGLEVFTSDLDESGISSIDKNLMNNLDGSIRYCYENLKYLLYQPPRVGGGVIPTVFEEIFCGSNLVEEVHGVAPTLCVRKGLIENERVIMRVETLNQLASLFGKANFGVASGSRAKTAEYVLGGLLRHFNPDAIVFLDDVEREENEILKNTGKMVNLKKPNAFSLLKAAEKLTPFKAVLHVGDSIEDALMSKEAGKNDPRFMFAGVYQYSGLDDTLLRSFIESEADIVLPSVNELPLILEKLKETKN